MPLISKTTFLEFQLCPRDTWLKLHKPELVEQFTPTAFELHLMEEGNAIEHVGRGLWPDGVLVTETGDEACRRTAELMAARTPAIFQATFVVDGFIAKCDVLAFNVAAESWDLYEIKGTNDKKEEGEDRDHISDLAFQKNVLERAGVKLGRLFIVHLDREYVRDGELDLEALFVKDDSTEQVAAIAQEIGEEMMVARGVLAREREPSITCDCHFKGRSRHCRTFAYSHPEIPEYSVHDLVRIGTSKKKLAYFMDHRIYTLDEVPDGFELGDAQQNQVLAHKRRAPIIDEQGIAAALERYRYPLYFFDYETYAPGIPTFAGFSPYQRIPFQFSLHILRRPGDALEHLEFLQPDLADPTEGVAKLLSEHIDPNGSVVVWYAPFERDVNAEIGKRAPAYRMALERLNGQIVDLREIFVDQHLVHPEFRGSTSIKAVLPVLVPELSYKDLAIQEGGTASKEWWRMVAAETPPAERQAIAAALKTYCARDTYAMVAIWQKLHELAATGASRQSA
ncbi:hypothetical protein HYPDE_26713 [Hyphomicrobium denitrificans 1NES1]|uniref:DUF2779 domain-containing protein n=1 Tax=Hyphomicrobium denitrificans 1NES1 TaxID=670307 RepID=N0B268_9HYPH|nr:DUF2779 domain-containing protein [Hyphomicrobium denitrificans]AGK57023.1 hypothetical protein HYPDE_26713 [Hyphomicrobium denitrificans 1NES1]